MIESSLGKFTRLFSVSLVAIYKFAGLPPSGTNTTFEANPYLSLLLAEQPGRYLDEIIEK
jgi:hypothetical protein